MVWSYTTHTIRINVPLCTLRRDKRLLSQLFQQQLRICLFHCNLCRFSIFAFLYCVERAVDICFSYSFIYWIGVCSTTKNACTMDSRRENVFYDEWLTKQQSETKQPNKHKTKQNKIINVNGIKKNEQNGENVEERKCASENVQNYGLGNCQINYDHFYPLSRSPSLSLPLAVRLSACILLIFANVDWHALLAAHLNYKRICVTSAHEPK